jgi:hypothetical protein
MSSESKKGKSAAGKKKKKTVHKATRTRRDISSSLLVSAMTVEPRSNIRVTLDTDPENARSESSIAVNPLNPYNMVAGSKRFTNPSQYQFSLAVYSTFDGGQSWTEAAPLILLPNWAGTSDPALAWDNQGHAYLVALPFGPGANTPLIGIAVYKSTDGGRTWGPPNLIHQSSGDDKQWAIGDGNPNSPHYGNVYAAWDDGAGIGASKLAFARTTDHGANWNGIKVGGADQPAGTPIPGVSDSGSPEFAIASDGTIYIVWTAEDTIKFVKSTNGGDSFSTPEVVASGITSLDGLPTTNGWHHFPGATFRVESFGTICTASGDNLLVAWPDLREGVSRIYYRRSTNGGNTWQGPTSGQRLLTGAITSPANQHDFMPQLISTPSGEIGCAFYELGPKSSVNYTSGGSSSTLPPLIDVIVAFSVDNGQSFSKRVTITDYPWDPAVDAPYSHGDPQVTFIGDYFGLDASRLGFFPLWTDTRTGIQEIFTARVNEI